jgi:Cytochrome c7 and related cytochrome c
MALLFPRWTNTVARLTVGLLLATPAIAIGALMLYVRSPLGTRQDEPIEQPVQFDHRHHVNDVGIDCRFCHQTVETGPSAGIPSTSVCLGCHSQVWNKSPLLQTVRASYFTDRPIPWNRVHNLPDFVYFNHSIHVNKGVGCATCHGRVDMMPAVQQVTPLTMQWCLDCHREPTKHLRPREEITSMSWMPSGDGQELGKALAREYGVHTRTSCTTCHR